MKNLIFLLSLLFLVSCAQTKVSPTGDKADMTKLDSADENGDKKQENQHFQRFSSNTRY